MHVKSGDKVEVIAGKERGKSGTILKVDKKRNRVVVEGLNILTKHVKPKGPQNPGGIVKTEGSIDVSNVLLFCPKCNRGVRTTKQFLENNKKVRVCTKCGERLDK